MQQCVIDGFISLSSDHAANGYTNKHYSDSVQLDDLTKAQVSVVDDLPAKPDDAGPGTSKDGSKDGSDDGGEEKPAEIKQVGAAEVVSFVL